MPPHARPGAVPGQQRSAPPLFLKAWISNAAWRKIKSTAKGLFRPPAGFPLGDHVPADPADHAEDFAHRYAEPLDSLAAIRMEELGIPSEGIGSSDHRHGLAGREFNPYERDGGGISPAAGSTSTPGHSTPIRSPSHTASGLGSSGRSRVCATAGVPSLPSKTPNGGWAATMMRRYGSLRRRTCRSATGRGRSWWRCGVAGWEGSPRAGWDAGSTPMCLPSRGPAKPSWS